MLKDLNIWPEYPDELPTVNRFQVSEVMALGLKVKLLQHRLAGQNRH